MVLKNPCLFNLPRNIWRITVASEALSNMKKETEGFKLSVRKISDKLKSVGNIWSDSNYEALSGQIKDLAKTSRETIENGEQTCSHVKRFNDIAAEKY
jgi:hypothetical protein